MFIKNPEKRLECIPNNEEKYTSFSKEIVLCYITDEERERKPVKREIRFTDSYRFMGLSLDALIKNLDPKQCKNLKKFYPVPGRPALRTASRGDFIVPRPRTNRKFGDRAFCVAAPRVWNRLPADLRQLRSTQIFRRHLKTFLFAASYWAPIGLNRHSWTM